MKQNFWNRSLSAVLALSITTAMAIPAYASGNAKYKAQDETMHTIRWTEGIAEPVMASGDEKGDFNEKQVTVAGTVFNVLEVPYRGAQGWYDLTQEKKPDPEQAERLEKEENPTEEIELVYNSGYAATAANLTYWWLEQNNANIHDFLTGKPKQVKGLQNPEKLYDMMAAPASQSAEESPVYKLYEEVFSEEAHPDLLLDFFLNGFTASENQSPNNSNGFKPHDEGGFLYPVLEKSILTRRDTANVENLVNAIAKNDGAILRLQKDDEIRYMNLWGVETTYGGEICALFVTDSQDDLGMIRFEVEEGDGLQIAGMKITGLYALNLGEVQWEAYVPAEKPESQDTKPKPAPEQEKPAITWKAPTYEWSEDYGTCTASRVSEDGSGKTEKESVKAISSQTKAPTHKENGILTYTADFDADWAETQVKTKELPKTKVQWNPPVYEWDESMRICKAKRTAQGDPTVVETAEVGVKAKETRAPSCTQKGQTTFTADFEEDWAETQEKVLDNIEMLSPNWDTTRYEWSADHKTCTAIRVCKNETDGSHAEKVQGTVTSEVTRKPTSTKKGETTYTAVFNLDWANSQKITVDDIPVMDTAWSEPVYTWSQDFKTCTAERTDKNDPGRKETAEAKITSSVSKKPTCKTEGDTTYTAEFSVDWAKSQVRTEKNIEKLKPDWGETRYQWSEDHKSCTAIRVCKNEPDHIETAAAKITAKETMAPSLTGKGETTYTAEFQVDWAKTQTKAVRDIPEVQDLWNTPQYDWTEDYSKCIATRTNQRNKDLIQTAYATVTSKKTKAPTNNMKGETTYTATFKESWANTQKKVVANIPAIPTNPNGKPKPTEPAQWNEPTYEWSEDYSRCTARRSRKGDDSNVDLTWATVSKKETRKPTCAQPGEAVYTADFTEKWAKDQKVKGIIPALPHKLEKVEEISATAAKEGMKAHYKCTECGKLFLDPEGSQEVTRDQLLVSNPTVAEGYAILNGVPEKDHLVAISKEKFQKTLDENPGSVGVSISVGSASVTYNKKDVETIIAAAGDNKKLQLEIYETDTTDSGLTLDQIKSLDKNPGGILYAVELSYVKNGKNVPIDNLTGSGVTVPYAGTDSVRIYQVEENGTFREVSGSRKDSFVTFQGGNGIYLLSESRPSGDAPQKKESKVGIIIWSSVLIVSGLLGIGNFGLYLYKKKLDREEAMSPHKFSHGGRSDFSEGDAGMDEEAYDPDFAGEMDLQNDFANPVLEAHSPEAVTRDNIAESDHTVDKKPVSPVAPKAPMQEKPTIAEKTASELNQKHLK